AFIIEYFLAKNDRPVSGVVAVIGYSLQVYDKIALFPFVGIVLSIAAIVLCKLRNAEPVVSTEPSPEPSEETPIIEKAPAAPAAPVSTKAPAAPAAPVSRSTPKAAPASEGARCPSCGKALRAGIAFCIYCGTPLAPAPAKPAEKKPEPVPPAAETGSKLRINMRVDKTSSGGDAKPSASGFKPAGDSDLD
ncbi:MAG: zinc ribbon domain-containing protein, partial [Oscillospiraceae bacterium]|nr:zinc ribbon domain-containing protein [Oscillospiraceae bacterium]